MSSARDNSGHFPLHLLVWNNDYRQLEKELRGQSPSSSESWKIRQRTDVEARHIVYNILIQQSYTFSVLTIISVVTICHQTTLLQYY
uniref:ankyrin repeat domain-containing protein 13A n=1 Tax=Halichoerus grypus TaxID=9711 RepID=UPI0016595C8A|nr:ankyrin repeat domain-containing protein 13A [Halichoerus grypus]